METRIFHVDAFTEAPFKGNPAAVCLLSENRDEAWMQAVAAEMNLSETAFLLASGDGYQLRWFTPTTEVPLCGHATLASAHVLWEVDEVQATKECRFHTRSGVLTARRDGTRIEMDFPAYPLEESRTPEPVLKALGVTPRFVGRTPVRGLEDRDYLLELDSEQMVRGRRADTGTRILDRWRPR